MDRQVAVREAAEDVRDLDHKRCPTSEAGHQPVEEGLERGAGRLGEVGVDGGRGNVGVPRRICTTRVSTPFSSSRVA